MRTKLIAMLALALAPGWLCGQPLPEPPPRVHEIPSWVAERLSPEDRRVFGKLMRLELESVWAKVVDEGYPNCFINELQALKPHVRMVGRARTIRYLPNRKDLRAKIYGARPQLNYVSSEDAQPGDILVFDAGGETRSAVTGNVTGTRLAYRGGVGMIADGAFRDVPALESMHLQIYMRRGQAAGVAPVQMSVDYQVPVRIGSVTVIPGDILFGERHGILVIPAEIVEKVADAAQATVEREEFQRHLLMNGESLFNVYPKLNDANQKRFEEWKKGAKR